MPEIEPDDFVVTDEQTRALLMGLLGKWSSPTAVGLFLVINRRIANRAAKRAQAKKRYFTTKEAYAELLGRAGDIFIERLGAAINNALCQALDDLADASADTAIEELPKPKHKRNRRGTVQHPAILVMWNSIAIVQAILATDESMSSRSFVAVLYYWQCNCKDSGALAEAWQKYCDLPRAQRDSRLRAYMKLLRDKGMKFEEIETAARGMLAGNEGTHTIHVRQPE